MGSDLALAIAFLPFFQVIMSNQISSQATKVWQLVSDSNTVNSYKQALDVTWLILKETGILLWLVICLVLVAFDWFWANSIHLGRQTRNWWENLEHRDTNRLASEAGQTLVSLGKTGLAFTLAQAREQLGLPQKPEATMEPPNQSQPVSISRETSTPAYTVSETVSSPQVTAKPNSEVKDHIP